MAEGITLVFICQKGELEIKAALLAASLRVILGNKISLHCSIPKIPGLETIPGRNTLDFLESLNVQCQLFVNPLMGGETNPLTGMQFSNKLFCFPNHLESDRVVFLDSDMLCINQPRSFYNIHSDLAVCQAFKSLNLNWGQLYSITGIAEPKLRVKSTLDGMIGYPYFNSGCISVKAQQVTKLLNAWRELFIQVRGLLKEEKHLLHSDQISLSLAIQKLEFSYLIFPDNYNYPSGSRLVGNDVYFAHYHGPEKIQRDPILYRQTINLFARFEEIRNIAAKYKYWNKMSSGSNNSSSINLIYHLKNALRKIPGKLT
jgi:lipopolysaccharide biosynthesis glycosyltransferase